jgi:reverse gyrase
VHRLYRNDDQGTEVHQRYLASPGAIAAAIARGWIDEGAVMCARP